MGLEQWPQRHTGRQTGDSSGCTGAIQNYIRAEVCSPSLMDGLTTLSVGQVILLPILTRQQGTTGSAKRLITSQAGIKINVGRWHPSTDELFLSWDFIKQAPISRRRQPKSQNFPRRHSTGCTKECTGPSILCGVYRLSYSCRLFSEMHASGKLVTAFEQCYCKQLNNAALCL